MKATPVQVLEAEAEVPPVQLQLDKRVMDSCVRKGYAETLALAAGKVINSGGHERKTKPPLTSMQVKNQWALKELGVGNRMEARTSGVQGEPPMILCVTSPVKCEEAD